MTERGPRQPDDTVAPNRRRGGEEREFLPAALEVLETPASPTARLFTWLICAVFAVALLWAWFGRIDIHAVAQGRVVPDGNVKVIQPLETAIVRAIHTRNGQRVLAGDVLIELDPTEDAATRAQTADALAKARVGAAGLREILDAIAEGRAIRELVLDPAWDLPEALVARERRVMMATYEQHRTELDSLDAQVAQKRAEKARVAQTLEERRMLVEVLAERMRQREELVERGVASRNELLEVASVYHENAADMAAEVGSLEEADAAIATLETQQREVAARFVAAIAQRLAEQEAEADSLVQDLVKAETRERRKVLTSPVDGVVQQVAVHTIGQVVSTGQQLMIVVPDGVGLEIEAMVLNRDKGFVAEGQEAVVKLEAFPFTRYGFIDGLVETVSNDAVQAGAPPISPTSPGEENGSALAQRGAAATGGLVFPTSVSLAQSHIVVDGREVPLTPGMAATVEIKTGDRRLIEYILTPLLRYGDEALRER